MKALGPKSLSSVIKTILDVAFYLTLVFGTLISIALITLPVLESEYLTRNPTVFFELEPTTYQVWSEELGIENAEISAARGSIEIQGVSRTRTLIELGLALLVVGVVALVFANLREIFKTLKKEDPFVRANAGRIRFIGFAIIFGEIGRALLVFGEALELKRDFTTVGLTLRAMFELELVPVLEGLVLLVIAEVFRLGAKMKEEQDLTV